jgi:hypothetical protein
MSALLVFTGCTSNSDATTPGAPPSDAGGPTSCGASCDAAVATDAAQRDDAASERDAGPNPGGDASLDVAARDVEAGPLGYSTNFLGSENPLSENGVWTNGGVVGLDWQNVRKNGGHAFASATSAGYNDCIAHLSGYPPNHFAQATVHVAAGYSAPDSHEIELLLRFKITAHSARGYEINCGWNGAYSQIVRWNGPLNDFTYLNPTGPGFGALAEGDVIRATAIGSTITVYKNGAQVMQVTDPTWADGNPGAGFFVRPNAAAVPESYCFSAFSAGVL